MKRVRIMLAMVLVVFASQSARAQMIQPGVAVRVQSRDSGSAVMHGTLRRLAGDTLFLTTSDFRPVALQWKDIAGAEYRDGRKPGAPYGLVGALMGAAMAVTALALLDRNGCDTVECRNVDLTPAYVMAGAVGAIIGGGVGYVLRPTLWRPLPR
jgi:hypothetical protein